MAMEQFVAWWWIWICTKMSNSTVLGNGLVTSFVCHKNTAESIQFELQLFSILESHCGLNRNSVIPLPNEIKYVGHVVQSSEDNFVISYSNTFPPTQFWIIILSGDGKKVIRSLDPKLGSVLTNLGVFGFDIDEDGQIFVADYGRNNVICLNSNLTDYRVILRRCRETTYYPCNVVYISEKRQLLVQEREGPVGYYQYSLSVFHLSPCSLFQQYRKPARNIL